MNARRNQPREVGWRNRRWTSRPRWPGGTRCCATRATARSAYLGTLADRPVAPARRPSRALDELDFALPAQGLAAPDVLRMLDEAGSPATVASNGPRYFGFVIGGALPAAQAAAWLGAAWDQNAALAVMSPVAARLNAVALRWITELSACRPEPRAASSPAPPWPTPPAWPRPGTRC